MNGHASQKDTKERRSEDRDGPVIYASVELFQEGLKFPYQFKIRNLSSKGMCILVKENSEILQHFSVGRQYQMKYYMKTPTGTSHVLNTEIKHITQGECKGHYLIGLAIV